MRAFVISGNIVLLALGVLALETLLMTALRHRIAGAPRPFETLVMALPGAGLLLAMYCALTHRAWQAIALCLSLSLVAHIADLACRCRAPMTGER